MKSARLKGGGFNLSYGNKNGFERIRRIKSFRLFKDSSEKNHAGRPISLNVEAWKRES